MWGALLFFVVVGAAKAEFVAEDSTALNAVASGVVDAEGRIILEDCRVILLWIVGIQLAQFLSHSWREAAR